MLIVSLLARSGRYRWLVCTLLFLATTVNYIDRQILSLLKETLDHEIGWTNEQFGMVNSAFQAAYGVEPFVRLLEGKALPDTKNVVGTNVIEIAWRLDPRTGRLVVMSAEDNLVKGASGQALQSMNLMCGFPETAGLM